MNEKNGQRTFPCPSCRREVAPSYEMKVKGFPCGASNNNGSHSNGNGHGSKLADDVMPETRSKLHSKLFQCPHCRQGIQIMFTVNIEEVQVFTNNGGLPKPAKRLISPEEERLLNQLVLDGMLAAFEEVVKATVKMGCNPPAEMGKYLLQYLSQVRPMGVPSCTTRWAGAEFRGQVEFWYHGDIAMIISNGAIKRFVPRQALLDQGGRQPLRVGGIRVQRGAVSLDDLIKTKYGLVPQGSGVFLQSIRQSLRTFVQ